MKHIKYSTVLSVVLLLCCLFLCACDNGHTEPAESGSGTATETGEATEGDSKPMERIDVYVAVNGSDDNDGSQAAPFATIKKARNALRKLRQSKKDIPATVHITAGEYRIQNIDFSFQDGGMEGAPVSYVGEGEVVLNGGMSLDAGSLEPLTDEEKSRLHGDAAEKVVRVDLTKLGLCADDWGDLCAIGTYNTAHMYDGGFTAPMWCELFINNTRQEIARYPDTGFLTTGKPAFEGQGRESGGKAKDYGDVSWYSLRNPESDIYRIDRETADRVATWKTTDGVWVFGYPMYNWADMSSPVTHIDTESLEMALQYVSLYGMKQGAPYYFYNVFEELDAPGEWYLDREAGILYFYPPKDCDLADADITLSLSTEPLLTGTGLKYFTVSGLSFTGTRGDALSLAGQHLTIENCSVFNVAGNAMILKGEHNTVRGCEIMHTGRGGILMEGGDRETLTPSGCVIENNHIHHIAEIYRTYQPGVDLKGVGILCRNNRIHDSAHMAIGFAGNNHIMEYNEIYAVCQIADDSSAIYAGRDYTVQGNVIRYNHFHDMMSDADSNIGIFGVYCDDNLGGTTIFGNVFERCQSAILLHGGQDMKVQNNLIIEACEKSQYAFRFHDYGYWSSLKEPDSTHAQRMATVPWQSDVWRAAYPHLAEYMTWEPEEQRYPHYAVIEDNIIIAHKGVDYRFDPKSDGFGNVFEDFIIIDEMPTEGLGELCETVLPTAYDGFAAIPFSKIGLQTE